MIEPQAAHTERMPAAKLGGRCGLVSHRHAAQSIGASRECVEHRRVVAAVRTALHQSAPCEPECAEHAEIFFERRIRRRIAAVVRIWKARCRSEYVAMRVA